MPRGIRRGEPDQPPTGTQVGSDAIRAPLVVERGLPHGSSHPGATAAHLAPYEDLAEVAKPDHPVQHPHGPPFTLGK